MRRSYLALLSVFLIVGCSDSSINEPHPEASLGLNLGGLTFYKFERDAYTAAQKSGSFWAVKGQDRAVALSYTDDGTAFVRFEVGANSLSTRPDGTAFEAGDSVLISITVDGTGRMKYAFEPSGLQFDPSAPARLTIDHSRADLLSRLLGLPVIYRRDSPTSPWLPTLTLNLLGNTAVTDVEHFTDFAIAVD
jgi:hypothetical protein